MNHVSIPKDPDSTVQLRPLVCFNEGMRSPYSDIDDRIYLFGNTSIQIFDPQGAFERTPKQ